MSIIDELERLEGSELLAKVLVGHKRGGQVVKEARALVLAAEELAEACEGAFDNINATGPQEFYVALDAYRKARETAQ